VKSEGIWLIVRAISFQDILIHQRHRQTDGQTLKFSGHSYVGRIAPSHGHLCDSSDFLLFRLAVLVYALRVSGLPDLLSLATVRCRQLLQSASALSSEPSAGISTSAAITQGFIEAPFGELLARSIAASKTQGLQ